MSKLSASRSPVRLAVALGALVLGSTALAQEAPPLPGSPEDLRLKPPVPSIPRNEASDILGIVFAVILGAAVVGVNAIPGRRGHQD